MNSPTQLYRNQTAKAGLRVPLRGPDGIDAELGLKSDDHLGPARELSPPKGSVLIIDHTSDRRD